MMENKGTQTTYTKPLAMTGTGMLALALLTGCTTAEPEANGTPADNGAATATTAPAETSAATGGDTDDQGTSSAPATAGSAPAASGDDPVFAAIGALHSEHPDAIIVAIDQDDDDTRYEVEAVVGDRILDFDVMTDGSVREDDDEDDDDDLRKAREATVTAAQAAEAALEGRNGQAIDEMELDEEDDTLVWKVELDDDQGRDGDELRIDAKSGEVRTDN